MIKFYLYVIEVEDYFKCTKERLKMVNLFNGGQLIRLSNECEDKLKSSDPTAKECDSLLKIISFFHTISGLEHM